MPLFLVPLAGLVGLFWLNKPVTAAAAQETEIVNTENSFSLPWPVSVTLIAASLIIVYLLVKKVLK